MPVKKIKKFNFFKHLRENKGLNTDLYREKVEFFDFSENRNQLMIKDLDLFPERQLIPHLNKIQVIAMKNPDFKKKVLGFAEKAWNKSFKELEQDLILQKDLFKNFETGVKHNFELGNISEEYMSKLRDKEFFETNWKLIVLNYVLIEKYKH